MVAVIEPDSTTRWLRGAGSTGIGSGANIGWLGDTVIAGGYFLGTVIWPLCGGQDPLFADFTEACWAAVVDRRYLRHVSREFAYRIGKHYKISPRAGTTEDLWKSGELSNAVRGPQFVAIHLLELRRSSCSFPPTSYPPFNRSKPLCRGTSPTFASTFSVAAIKRLQKGLGGVALRNRFRSAARPGRGASGGAVVRPADSVAPARRPRSDPPRR